MTTQIPATEIHPLIDPIGHREGCDLAEIAYSRFADVVETFDDADWDRPTDCEGWTVRHIVAHMVGAMRSAASLREMMSQQRDIRAHVKQFGGSEVDAMTQVQIDRTWDSINAELVQECRAQVGRAAAGRRKTPAPMRRFVTFPVEMGSINERWTLGYLVDVILTRDAWLHRIDVSRAIGEEPYLTADHDGRIVADVVSEWARRHSQPFTLHLTGVAGGTYTSGSGGDVIELDAVEFCRTVSGREDGVGLLATAIPF